MDVFFAGNHFGDSGPRIVNRNLIRCLKDEVSYISSESRIQRILEVIWKTLRCRVIIFSGVTSYDSLVIPLCRILGKRMVFIMHGLLLLENQANGYTNRRGEKNEALLLKYAETILCVSETYMRFIKKQFPQYAHKTSFLTNGIDWQMPDRIPQNAVARDKKRIVLIGGGRTTKRNLEVCKAVALLNERFQTGFYVEVYGEYSKNDMSQKISEAPYVSFLPLVPHDKMLEVFRSAFLFVQNSDFEPFSLGVIESLVCGCSVLISENVGAKDILNGLIPADIITDTADIEQIADKILVLSREGNSQRLLSSIDKEASSIQCSAKKLMSIIRNIS